MPIDQSFRASDDDREHVVTILREQTVIGRLTSAELDERVGLAYAAKTWGELRRLVWDLPVTVRFADDRVPAAPPVRPSRLRPVPRLVPMATLMLLIALVSGRLILFVPFVLLLMVIAVMIYGNGRARRR